MRQTGELKFNQSNLNCAEQMVLKETKGANKTSSEVLYLAKYCLCCLEEDKTINEIADCLGVSHMWKAKQSIFQIWIPHQVKANIVANILLDYPTNELISLHDEMYRESSKALCK